MWAPAKPRPQSPDEREKQAIITAGEAVINDVLKPRYLAEFEYRFNRRYDLAAMLPRLTWAAVRTPPMPYRLLKLPDVYA